jgi:formate-dependent nitrite reductase membrane component NrfD
LTKFKTNIIEAALAILTLLSIVGLCIYFYDLNKPNQTQNNPFETFDNNIGIIKISIASLVSRSIFLGCFALLTFDKYRHDKKILTFYIISALTIAVLQWYELYFGSTFYYGEVRDKQGLMFPLLASFMLTLVIWKINYSKAKNSNLIIKLTLTGLVNIGLYFLWTQVYEPWNLWQS